MFDVSYSVEDLAVAVPSVQTKETVNVFSDHLVVQVSARLFLRLLSSAGALHLDPCASVFYVV